MLLIFDDFQLIENEKIPLAEDLKLALMNLKDSKLLLISDKPTTLDKMVACSYQIKPLSDEDSQEILL